jgi:hypothetical protein
MQRLKYYRICLSHLLSIHTLIILGDNLIEPYSAVLICCIIWSHSDYKILLSVPGKFFTIVVLDFYLCFLYAFFKHCVKFSKYFDRKIELEHSFYLRHLTKFICYSSVFCRYLIWSFAFTQILGEMNECANWFWLAKFGGNMNYATT